MKAAISLTFVIFLFAGLSVQAQKRTVSNADLEKFRQKRLQAEQEYRDNYEKMGFPSPEDLQRQLEQSKADQLELSARLAAERLERERLEIDRERLAMEWENVALERQAMQNAPLQNGFYGGYNYSGYPGVYILGRPFRGIRGSRFARTYTNVGNGIPLVNYFGTPRTRGPAVRMGRR